MIQKKMGVLIDNGPSDWQVLQQNDRGFAAVDLSGRWHAQEQKRRVEARVVYESPSAPATKSLDWTPAEARDDNTWSITLPNIPAGGPYRIETRVWRRGGPDERPLRGDYVHHLGVGDLWCIAGQSNASGTGLGIAEDGPELGVHLFANDETWKLACHPLEDATNTLHPITITGIFHGHSPWLAFAKMLKRHLAIPIGLIPTALGGSALRPWNPKDKGKPVLYENMMDMIRKAGGRIKGIVWYQGESDANSENAASYKDRFAQFVSSVREGLNTPDLPILTAQLSRCTNPVPSKELDQAWTVLREQQRQAAKQISNVHVIPTLDLPLSDDIHISAPGCVTLGQRFADVALGKVYGHPVSDTFPEIASAHFRDGERRELVLTFDHVPGGWHPRKPPEGFTVEGPDGFIPIEWTDFGEGSQIILRLAGPTEGPVTVHGAYGRNPKVRLCDANQRPFVAFSTQVA
ncbi:MAG: sialate O-acetylesterase [Planctomycetes bacterium]|nr:sialate O-acetylesterase [Planctomycetota bacterium]